MVGGMQPASTPLLAGRVLGHSVVGGLVRRPTIALPSNSYWYYAAMSCASDLSRRCPGSKYARSRLRPLIFNGLCHLKSSCWCWPAYYSTITSSIPCQASCSITDSHFSISARALHFACLRCSVSKHFLKCCFV